MDKALRATSFYLTDTCLHWLNGSCVVEVKGLPNPPWLSPDQADAFADSLKEAASAAREWRETDDDDDE